MPIVTRIWLGVALLLIAAAVWLAPALLSMALEPALVGGFGWVRATFGDSGIYVVVAMMVGVIVGGQLWGRSIQRRHEARQFAADRTIHVEKPREMGGAEKAFLVVAGGALWLGVMGLIVQAVVVTVR